MIELAIQLEGGSFVPSSSQRRLVLIASFDLAFPIAAAPCSCARPAAHDDRGSVG